jgi:cytochrome bd-type quinol oxidase subunit 2
MKSFFEQTYSRNAIVSGALFVLMLLLFINSASKGDIDLDFIRSWGVMITVLVIHSTGLLFAISAVRRSSENQPTNHKLVLLILTVLHMIILTLYPTVFFFLD